MQVLRGLGVEAPEPRVDPVELLEAYVDDDGVTLVFTRSIAAAERLARRLRERLGEEKAGLVATHHHLVPRDERRRVEEAARRGEVRVIFTPRTLSQGIDIGTVVRVVHYGLPEDVREYLQREGRKGRRASIPYTETVIIPTGTWDRELLGKGVSALLEWLSLPLERVEVNPGNLYASLFTGLWKTVKGLLDELTEDERRALETAGVLRDGRVDRRRLKWAWERLNFYEFGPPYGIKRYLVRRSGERIPLEPIGFCDLVEHFQQGCIDAANEAIVVGFQRGGRGHVTAVYEEPVHEIDFYRYPALADAAEEYELAKRRWGEEPNLRRDILRGAVVSQAVAVVHPPKRGFGRLIKIPNRVVWVVYGEKPVVVKGPGGETLAAERRAAVYVTGETAGVYTDYTYGYVVELPPWEDPSLVRIGLALLNLVLRKEYGIAFETIMYSVERLGDYKAVAIHEPEAAGLIERLDWREVARRVEAYKPSSLDLALIASFDEVAYAEFLGRSLDWELAKTYAKRVALMIAEHLGTPEELEVAGVKLRLPKPGPEHRILALGVAALEETAPRVAAALALFDGENLYKWSGELYTVRGVRPPDELRSLEILAQELVDYEGYTLVTSSREASETLEKLGLRLLARLAREAATAEDEWSKTRLPGEAQPLAVRIAAEKLEWSLPDPTDLAAKAAEAKEKGRKKQMLDALEKAAEAVARTTYLTALIAKSCTEGC